MKWGALLVVALITGCSGSSPAAPAPSPSPGSPASAPVRVLMLTATAGFRHDSIPVARQVMSALAASSGSFTVTATEDLSVLSASGLGGYDVLCFALTSGELALDDARKAAITSFVRGGKGFLGVHSATDTLYSWPEYGRLTGAYFREHPWTQIGTVIVENGAHPATDGLGERFAIREEFYTFRENPRPQVQVLLRLDPDSVGGSGDLPLAWAHDVGEGRAYYNALGHFDETWRDPRFQQQLAGAIRWLAKR